MSTWSSSTSGIKNPSAPVALNFSIPAEFTQSINGIALTDSSTAQYQISPPLIIPDGCQAHLVAASFPYSQPNIAGAADGIGGIPSGNNRVSVNFNGGGYVSSSEMIIPTGLYTYSDVQYAWNSFAIAAGWVPSSAPIQNLFTFTGISATQQLVITLNPLALTGGVVPTGGIILNFTNPSPYSALNDSIGNILGWPTTGSGAIITWTPGSALSIASPFSANFAATSAYDLYFSLVTNSYFNGSTGSILYAFPLGNSAPNSVVSYQATLPYPVQISSGTYSTVRIWTTDQNGNRLPWKFYQAPFQFSMVISKNHADGSL